MKWALDNPDRFLHERAELDRLDKDADWLSLAWRLDAEFSVQVDLDFKIHGKTYAATLTYPDLFPETPPYIRPRDSAEQWSVHQYGPGGPLCLKRRADNWDSRFTGADLVLEAYELLSTEQDPEQPARVPSEHRVTPGQTMRSKAHRLVCTPALRSFVESLSLQTTSALYTNTVLHRSATVAFISQVVQGEGAKTSLDLPSGLAAYFPFYAWRGDAVLYKNESFERSAKIDTVESLLAAIGTAGFQKENALVRDAESTKLTDRLVLLVGRDFQSLRAFGIEDGDKATLNEYSVIFPEETSHRIPPEFSDLASIRFGIVGLGSIGSKVAASLARSGARKFLLIDDDYLIPENLCRNELSWIAVGVHKVEGVKEMLSLIAPGMDIEVRTHRLAGQESSVSAAQVLKDLSSCDVIVDATAIPEVFVRVAAIAKAARRRLCWGELFAGGSGGLIARARPDIEPNPLAVRAAVHRYMDTLPAARNQNANRYDAGSEQPLVAGDAEVTQVASALTRLVIDSAVHPGTSEFPFAAYLIGLRKEDGWFSQPFDVHPIEVSGGGWQSDVEPEVHKRQQKEAVQDLMKIMISSRHADADPPA